jgi:hypothetical protein
MLSWAKAAVGEPGAASAGEDVAVLSDGSAVVAGWLQGSAVFGSGATGTNSATSLGRTDALVAKYAPNGDLSWLRTSGAADSDAFAYGVATRADSIVVTGHFGGSALFSRGAPDARTLVAEGTRDCFIANYETDGRLRWLSQVRGRAGEGAVLCNAIGLTNDGIFVTGYYYRSATFGAGEERVTTVTSETPFDPTGFLAKYALDGKLAWAATMSGRSEGTGVVGLADGSIILSGQSGDPTGAAELFVARYSGDGTPTWKRGIAGRLNFGALAVAALPDGTSWLVGTFQDTVVFGRGESTEIPLHAAGGFSYDVFLAQYAPDGALAWARRIGDTGHDIGHHVAVQTDGTAIVTGYFEGVLATEPALDPAIISNGARDVFVVAYSRDGTFRWAKQAGGAREDVGYGLAVHPNGSVFFTGHINATPSPGGIYATFGAGEPNQTVLGGPAWQDMFLAKLQTCE